MITSVWEAVCRRSWLSFQRTTIACVRDSLIFGRLCGHTLQSMLAGSPSVVLPAKRTYNVSYTILADGRRSYDKRATFSRRIIASQRQPTHFRQACVSATLSAARPEGMYIRPTLPSLWPASPSIHPPSVVPVQRRRF